ncbi:hypothetical protein C8R47DRAFT_767795 [Mycena vitilis]|nr:hypothetical protein C8R47DRAFT_767795 [Mycena vitilis]
MTTAVTGQGLGLILPAGTFKYGEVTRRDSERNPSVDVHSHALTKPPDTVRHDHVLSHPSTYASLDIRRRIDSVLDFAAEQTTAAVILDILRRDAQSRSTCDSVVEQLLPFLAKVFSEPVVEEVAEYVIILSVYHLLSILICLGSSASWGLSPCRKRRCSMLLATSSPRTVQKIRR